MANEPQLSKSRLTELEGIIVSEGEDDIAQLRSIAAELLAEVRRCHLRIASQDQHVEVITEQIERLTTIESEAATN